MRRSVGDNRWSSANVGEPRRATSTDSGSQWKPGSPLAAFRTRAISSPVAHADAKHECIAHVDDRNVVEARLRFVSCRDTDDSVAADPDTSGEGRRGIRHRRDSALDD